MQKNNNLDHLLGIRMSGALLVMKALLVNEFESKKQYLSFEEWMNLLPILENHDLTQKDYAKLLGKDKTTISRMLKSWEMRGIVKRETSQKDGRAVVLSLTPKAKNYHDQAKPIVFAIDRIFKEALDKEEEERFLFLLQKIKHATEEELLKRL